VLDIDPRHPEANTAIARILVSKGEIDAAISAYRKVAAASPSDTAVQYAIADLYLKKKSLSGAIVAYRQILTINPDDARAHLALGKALAQQKRRSEASKSLERAQKLYTLAGDHKAASEAKSLLEEL
jgi:tetratricopeptide (TPR) repeat protein